MLLILSLFAKALAFLREVLLAYYFGVGAMLDAFNAGITFSNSLLFIFSGGAFIPILISFAVGLKGSGQKREFNGFMIFLFGLSIVISTIVVLLAPYLVLNVSDTIKESVILVLRVTAFSSAFYALSSIIRAYLNSRDEYTLSGAQDLTMILVIITGIVLASNSENPLLTLSYSFLISSVFRVLVQIPALIRYRKELFIGVDFNRSSILQYSKLLFPMVIATLIPQLMVVITRLVSSHIGQGAISGLSYADRTSDLIKSVVAFSLGAVIVAPMSKYIQEGNRKKFMEILNKALLFSFFVSIPLFFIFLLWGSEIIKVVYERGSFTSEATLITGTALSYYSLATLFSSPIYILMSAMYSLKNWKGVLTTTTLSVFIAVIFMLLTYRTWGIIGVALSLGIYSLLSFTMLYTIIIRENIEFSSINLLRPLSKLLLVNLITFITGYFLYLINPFYALLSPLIYIITSRKLGEVIYLQVVEMIGKALRNRRI